jgi:hypothetical protein
LYIYIYSCLIIFVVVSTCGVSVGLVVIVRSWDGTGIIHRCLFGGSMLVHNTGKDLEVSDPGLIEVLSQHLLGVTEENHENPRAGWPVSQLGFVLSTYRIQV